MAEDQLLRIKRSPDSHDGIIFAYLKNQGQPQNDLACEAIRSYWLPLALKEQGIKKKELKSVAQKAIAQLRQQIEVIRLACELGMDEMPFNHSYGVAPSNVVAVPANSTQPALGKTENVENTDDVVDIKEDIEEDDDDDNGMWEFSELDPGFRT